MMSWLNDLKVAQKLAFLISVLLIAVICVGGTGYYFLSKTNDALNTMYSEKLMAVELLNENRAHARKIEVDTLALMLTTDCCCSSYLTVSFSNSLSVNLSHIA